MAPRKKKIETVDTDSYSALETYCIWLNEYYKALKKSGFTESIALAIMMDKCLIQIGYLTRCLKMQTLQTI